MLGLAVSSRDGVDGLALHLGGPPLDFVLHAADSLFSLALSLSDLFLEELSLLLVLLQTSLKCGNTVMVRSPRPLEPVFASRALESDLRAVFDQMPLQLLGRTHLRLELALLERAASGDLLAIDAIDEEVGEVVEIGKLSLVHRTGDGQDRFLRKLLNLEFVAGNVLRFPQGGLLGLFERRSPWSTHRRTGLRAMIACNIINFFDHLVYAEALALSVLLLHDLVLLLRERHDLLFFFHAGLAEAVVVFHHEVEEIVQLELDIVHFLFLELGFFFAIILQLLSGFSGLILIKHVVNATL
mmetsp:Transcript_13596/g.21255  ORF Transcript_13596/g.21255 Transcript_13596/m.21255 type:complete len:298 (+) Transcript_13596:1282-2175(+)